MAETSQMVRSYLKNLGYTDDDITYQKGTNGQPGTVNLQGKFFTQGTPDADGYIRADQSGLNAAFNQFKGNQLTTQANDSRDKQNELLEQYQNRIMQPVRPFTYDVNQIKNDPTYQSQLNSFTQDTNRGTNQALVNLGRRGIGNSQSGVVAETAGQQNINNFANNELLPRLIAEAYSKYVDQNNMNRQQNQDILGLAGVYDGQNQDFYDRGRDNVGDQRYNSEVAYQQEQDRLNREYQTARDSIADERYKEEFDRDNERYGLEFAIKKAESNNMMANRNAGTANTANNTKIDNLMATFKATGIAPAGLESMGINKGDRLPVESSESGDYTTDPVFTRSVQAAGTGDLTSAEILGDAQNIINELTYKGYNELLETARAYEKNLESESGY